MAKARPPDPIDEAWELLEDGDVAGAEAACRRAEAAGGAEPEVLFLRGALAAARDEPERALELLARAADADPGSPHPLLQAAELELYSRGDADAALVLIERALERCDDDEELADAVLLKAEAELSGDEGGARARTTLLELDGISLGDPSLLVRAGQLLYAVEDDRRAETAFLAALEEDGGLADAHHGLGLVYEVRGDREAMVKAWLDTRRLDLAEPPPPWHLSGDEFEAVAEAAMRELPAEVIDRLANVPVLIDDAPGDDLIAEGWDPRIFGLFSGIPLGDQSAVGGAPQLDSIHLYQKNLERAVGSKDELEDEIRTTVLHETAHFFGLDDDDLERLGLE